MNLALLDTYQNNLIKFSQIDEETIQKIFIRPAETPTTDFSTVKYYPYPQQTPLYIHFIMKFRNMHHKYSAIEFYNSCDYFNKRLLLIYYDWWLRKGSANIMDFFSWIRNMLGLHDIREIVHKIEFVIPTYTLHLKWIEWLKLYFGPDITEVIFLYIYKLHCLNTWKTNEIGFFFLLPTKNKELVIKMYNDQPTYV